MNSIIDIYNNILIYNNNTIDYVLDNNCNIWFKFITISNLLNYKSRKDALRDLISKDNKKRLKEIKKIFKNSGNFLYRLIILFFIKTALY